MKNNIRNTAGALLVLVGALIGISNLHVLGDMSRGIGLALVYVVLGAAILYYYRLNTSQKWMLVATLASFALAVVQVSSLYLINGSHVMVISQGLLALTLVIIFLMDLQKWWLVIPAGLIAALAVTEWVRIGNLDLPIGGSLFIGTGLSFLLLFFLPAKMGKMSWSLIPAAVLLTIGVFATYRDVTQVAGYIIPVLLLVAGGAVLLYTYRRVQ